MSNIAVTLYPDEIGHIGPISVTNTMISSLTVSLLLIVFALWIRRGLGVKPTHRQVFFEMMVTMIMDKMSLAFGGEARARKYFPLIFTIFMFILFSNYFTMIPFIESIVTSDGISIFSTPTAHYSQTIALVILMMGGAHFLAFLISPIRHVGNFIKLGPLFKARSVSDFGMAFIDIFLGMLDIVGEIAKLISLSTRLFGNLVAGSVIITIVSGLSFYTQFIVPLPFIVLGLLSGFVQAFVFSMLGALFMGGLITGASPAEETTEQTI